MSTDENKFWKIKNTSRNGCVQLIKDFDKWLCKKILQIDMNIMRTNKFFIGGLRGVLVSSIVNEVIGTISSLLFFFFYGKILSAKKAPKSKLMIFTFLEVFACAKNCCLYCLVFAFFVLLVGFCLWRVFARLNFFRKKNKQGWNCPDSLIY